MIRKPYPTEKEIRSVKDSYSERLQGGTGKDGGSVREYTARNKRYGYGRG